MGDRSPAATRPIARDMTMSVRPYRDIDRRRCREIHVGDVAVFGDGAEQSHEADVGGVAGAAQPTVQLGVEA